MKPLACRRATLSFFAMGSASSSLSMPSAEIKMSTRREYPVRAYHQHSPRHCRPHRHHPGACSGTPWPFGVVCPPQSHRCCHHHQRRFLLRYLPPTVKLPFEHVHPVEGGSESGQVSHGAMYMFLAAKFCRFFFFRVELFIYGKGDAQDTHEHTRKAPTSLPSSSLLAVQSSLPVGSCR